MVVVLVLLIMVAFERGYDVANGVVALLLSRVEFERRNAVVDGMVVLPLRPVMGEISYPDPRKVALALKLLLRYVPSCRTLDAVVCEAVALATESVVVCGTVVLATESVVVCGTVVLATESVVVCGTAVRDTRGAVVELWYDTDTVDELPTEIVKPQATPKQ